MNWEQKHILVIGAGKSGIAACRLLAKEPVFVVLYDSNKSLDREEVQKKLGDEFRGELVFGEMTEELLSWTELLILSPGVPTDLPFVEALKRRGVSVWGEVELAYRFAKGKLIAVTGTNGKTTTTALIGEILRTHFSEVYVVGNIGTPYTEMVSKMSEQSVTAAEMSSFQLESIEQFHPCVSLILNITPDHLDRHHTMEAYVGAKLNICRNQTTEEVCILNHEDARLLEAAQTLGTKILWFSSAERLEEGLFLEQEEIIYRKDGKDTPIIHVNELNIIGKHNYENAMAAIGAGISMNIPLDKIRMALRAFVAVEHRIEYTATKNGVRYYNDSKGTNPDASIQAVRAMSVPTILIGGGYDKGSTYEEWIASFDGKIRWLVLLGQTADKIEATARKMGFTAIARVSSMEEAVAFSYEHARPGEAVLLSPCCASWGMFKNYEERGTIFKELVRKLPE